MINSEPLLFLNNQSSFIISALLAIDTNKGGKEVEVILLL